MSDGTVMDDSEMSPAPGASPDSMHADEDQTGTGPSSTARMICSDETADAVRRSFALRTAPAGADAWKEPVYTCTYRLRHGDLTLSVADLSARSGGRAWYDELRHRLGGTRPVTGMQNFGFPAFETDQGDVVFLKDGKTLWVDASHVRDADLPPGFTRTDTAYGVAAAVIACWTE